MFRRDRDHDHTLSWVAIILSIAAIVMSAMAITATGGWDEVARTSEQAGEEVVEFTGNIGEDVETAFARVGANLDAEFNEEAAAEEVREVRIDLRDEYEDAEGAVVASWQEVDAGLERVGEQVEDGTITTIEGLQQALENLQQSIDSIDE